MLYKFDRLFDSVCITPEYLEWMKRHHHNLPSVLPEYARRVRGPDKLMPSNMKRITQKEFLTALTDNLWMFVDEFTEGNENIVIYVDGSYAGVGVRRDRYKGTVSCFSHTSCLHHWLPDPNSVIRTRNGREPTQRMCTDCGMREMMI